MQHHDKAAPRHRVRLLGIEHVERSVEQRLDRTINQKGERERGRQGEGEGEKGRESPRRARRPVARGVGVALCGRDDAARWSGRVPTTAGWDGRAARTASRSEPVPSSGETSKPNTRRIVIVKRSRVICGRGCARRGEEEERRRRAEEKSGGEERRRRRRTAGTVCGVRGRGTPHVTPHVTRSEREHCFPQTATGASRATQITSSRPSSTRTRRARRRPSHLCPCASSFLRRKTRRRTAPSSHLARALHTEPNA